MAVAKMRECEGFRGELAFEREDLTIEEGGL